MLVELFENFPLDSPHHQPDCVHRRPAPWSRIKQQLQRESAFIDDGGGGNEFTAWEFHSYLSPFAGPCGWAQSSERNASDGLYQTYKRYVEGLFPRQKTDDGGRAVGKPGVKTDGASEL